MAEDSPYHAPERPGASPEAEPEAPILSAAIEEREVTGGGRVAGGFLLAQGVLGLLLYLWASSRGWGAPVNVVAIAVDGFIGGLLLAGNGRIVPWAKFRCVLGGVLVTGVFLAKGSLVAAFVQAAYCGAVAGLLFGNATTLRIAISSAGMAVVMLLQGLLLTGTVVQDTPQPDEPGRSGGSSVSKSPPRLPLRLSATDDLEGEAVTEVRGDRFAWRLSFPAGGAWRARRADTARRDHASADRWLELPEHGAHVMVLAARVGTSSRAELEDDVLADALGSLQGFVLDFNRPIEPPAPGAGGRLLKGRGRLGGHEVVLVVGLFARKLEAFRVVAWVEAGRSAELEGQLQQIVSSFEMLPP